MEKIIQRAKRKDDDHTYTTYRFQCECLDAAQAMDVDVEYWGKNDEEKFICIRMDDDSSDSFFRRLKYAFNVFRRKWSWREFYVREEDYKALSEIFDPNKTYKDLP